MVFFKFPQIVNIEYSCRILNKVALFCLYNWYYLLDDLAKKCLPCSQIRQSVQHSKLNNCFFCAWKSSCHSVARQIFASCPFHQQEIIKILQEIRDLIGIWNKKQLLNEMFYVVGRFGQKLNFVLTLTIMKPYLRWNVLYFL